MKKNFIRSASFVLAFIAAATFLTSRRVLSSAKATGSDDTAQAAFPFTDVDSKDPHYEAIEYMYQNKFIRGKSADTFAPDAPLTREQAATVWARTNQYLQGGEFKLHNFADVPKVSEMELAIITEFIRGDFKGKSEEFFDRKANITRGEIIYLVIQTYFPDAELEFETDNNETDVEQHFTDTSGKLLKFQRALHYAVENGLLDDVFTDAPPDDSKAFVSTKAVTRGEMCELIWNIMYPEHEKTPPEQEPETTAPPETTEPPETTQPPEGPPNPPVTTPGGSEGTEPGEPEPETESNLEPEPAPENTPESEPEPESESES